MICFRHSFRAAVCFAALLSLVGCGRRGPLEPPPGASVPTAPQTTAEGAGLPRNGEIAPIDAASASSPSAPAEASGQGPENPAATPAKAPRRPFVLDPLL